MKDNAEWLEEATYLAVESLSNTLTLLRKYATFQALSAKENEILRVYVERLGSLPQAQKRARL